MDLAAITEWTPTTTATSTTLSTIAATYVPALQSKISDAVHTLTSKGSTIANMDYISASRIIRGAQASLSIISAEQVLETATANNIQAQATQIIWQATENLLDLAWEENVYDIPRLNRTANIIFLVLFAITFAISCLMWIKSRYWWFNVAWTCGTALEFLGYLGRVLSFSDMKKFDYYLLQLIALTLSPVFLMAGIYFLFGQLVVIHGRHYSWLKPLHYSYIFITCDVVSLVIQAVGGGMTAIAAQEYRDANPGTYTMIAGIAFQVFSMSVFLLCWLVFCWNTYFLDVTAKETKQSPYQKKSLVTFIKLLLNGDDANMYKLKVLDKYYNPGYKDLRKRPLYNYYALAITLAVIAVYIRCIYRVVELAQGFSGYLITHEVYIMTLDATMIGICCIIFILFHPHLVMGSSIAIGLRSIAKNKDQETGDNLNKEKINDIVSDNEESTLQGQNVFRGEPNQEYKE
ncbi:RTA1-domain protein, putative [Candida dubliniensis CD36]|uniref:Sphingoid long-chain base transporter RSB1 n=1 Tax=Candida dubliniensis (strain CD36 / ATCC MYA-646 / CBS 7987 / NCPF 3949 / NRRL Y-17841) TaxID=573826 RepID=B9WBU1_CANDC|nr:RTA1-domain protein, putative [Candida dubliniensis CD36]CAX43863.1 RTA1-domain protein, putative [Candida dubliniensis CD36]